MIERIFTTADKKAVDCFEYKTYRSVLKNNIGETLFDKEVIVPVLWSSLACDILAQKYMRADETDVRQVVGRIAAFISATAVEQNLCTPIEANILEEEYIYHLIDQRLAPNSPIWFNSGLYNSYGMAGQPNECWHLENTKIVKNTSEYEYPLGSACFIQGIEDDLIGGNGIMALLKKETQVFKYGAGSGTNYSAVRGRGEKLSGGGTSSGLMSFLRTADTNAGAIKSGGTTRRAARMIALNTDHPDIEEFVVAKAREERLIETLVLGNRIKNECIEDIVKHYGSDSLEFCLSNCRRKGLSDNEIEKTLSLLAQGLTPTTETIASNYEGRAYDIIGFQNGNTSVRTTAEFMEAARNGEKYDLINRTDGKIAKTISASALFDSICTSTWECGDPGLQFDDTMNTWNTVANTHRLNCTNPCSEVSFIDDSACNLASINLLKYYDNGVFNAKLFANSTAMLTTILEATINACSYPSYKIADNSIRYRPIGLGYANLGALLMAMGLAYDSEGALRVAGDITSLMTACAYKTSADMAEKVGAFEGFSINKSSMIEVIKKHIGYNTTDSPIGELALSYWEHALDKGIKTGFRNAQVTLLAPTGTIGLLMDCDTTGIEPDYALVKYKKLAGGGGVKIVTAGVEKALINLKYTTEEIKAIESRIEAEEDFKALLKPEHRHIFDCANEIVAEGHIRMMAAVQPFLSGAISKTVNMPNSATVADIRSAYLLAYELGVKAVAIYRDGSKASQPLNKNKKTDNMVIDTSLDGKVFSDKEIALTKGSDFQKVLTNGVYVEKPDYLSNIEILPKIISEECNCLPDAIEGQIGFTIQNAQRKYLPKKRAGITQEARIAGQNVFIRTGEYEDGTCGEIFIDVYKEGASFKGLLNCFAILASKALQYGMPLEELVETFTFTRFEPSGFVSGCDDIKSCTSILDLVFKIVSNNYLKPQDDKPKPEVRYIKEVNFQPKPDKTGTDSDPIVPLSKTYEPYNRVLAISLNPNRKTVTETSTLTHETFTGKTSTLTHSTLSGRSTRSPKYSGEHCAICGSIRMRQNGSCKLCEDCGTTTGCS